MSYIPFEYPMPFKVEGNNPPTVVAANGEAVLSMLWTIHEQTPEAEAAAVKATEDLAEQIASLLNDNAASQAELATLRAANDALTRESCVLRTGVASLRSTLAERDKELAEVRATKLDLEIPVYEMLGVGEKLVPLPYLAAANARIAELEADKARLDWLQSNWEQVFQTVSIEGWCYWNRKLQHRGRRDTLREAIDAALAARKTEEGK